MGWAVKAGFLTAKQIISRVIKTFRVELPLRTLFETPTVAAGLAVTIVQPLGGEGRESRDGPLVG